ncbi:HSP20-like chaperone [Multifurca ochricompacta]|uniref:HSP20-like chaperone n=1 Tax=Multifurca ochricompacta TaxID=376703 RepID=A0AAD4M9G8_9AGAM|nr:HSP20-like chaperone [Multifurca ochricompacta]
MSITRQLFNEFRPLFRMLEEPLRGRLGTFRVPSRSIFDDDPFFTTPRLARPAVDISEEGNHYIIETELPGVKRDDVEVRIGDGDRSVTIEGNIVQRRIYVNGGESTVSNSDTDTPRVEGSSKAGNNQLSVERSFTGSSRFTRTIWLPRPADANSVTAKLADGILTVKIPKAEENDAVKVNIE